MAIYRHYYNKGHLHKDGTVLKTAIGLEETVTSGTAVKIYCCIVLGEKRHCEFSNTSLLIKCLGRWLVHVAS